MAQDVHEPMISEREAKLDKVLAQAEVLRTEIKVLREAQAMARGRKIEKAAPTRERQLKQEWIDVLQYIGARGPASLDDIISLVEVVGLGITKDTLRGQMANYEKRGWVDRVSPGVFQLTESGAAKCGYTGKEEAPKVGASDDVDASSDTSGEDQSDQWDEEPPEF